MNVSLILLILVAYLQDSGVLCTVKSVLGPVETFVLSGFCAELCQYNCPSPEAVPWAINGESISIS